MPKPTLIQRAFGIPTTTYADNGGAPLSSSMSHTSGYAGSLRAPSIRSVTSSRAPSETGRSRRSVTFDDGASDGGRSYTSSIASRDTMTSKRSALSAFRSKRNSSYSSQNSAIDVGPSLRNGQQPGLLQSGGSLRIAKPGTKTSRRYSSAENLAALRAREQQQQRPDLTLPPPPLTRAEEAYAASQKRIAGLASIDGSPASANELRNSASNATLRPVSSADRLRTSSGSEQLRLSTDSSASSLSNQSRAKRTSSLNAGTAGPKRKTPEEIVAALEKAGLLDRVMEVVHEEDETSTHTPTPRLEKESWLTPEPSKDAASTPLSAPVEEKPPAPIIAAPQAIPARTFTLNDFAVSRMASPPPPKQPVQPAVETVTAPPITSPPVSEAPAPAVEHTAPVTQQVELKEAPMPSPAAGSAQESVAAASSVIEPATATSVPKAADEREEVHAPKPQIFQLLDAPLAAPSDASPAVLQKLSLSRSSGRLVLNGRVKGFSPPYNVLIRYTTNSWRSQSDVEAMTEAQGVFEAALASSLDGAGRVEMALRLRDATGREVWQSNEGKNFGASVDAVHAVIAAAGQPTTSKAVAAAPQNRLVPALALAVPLFSASSPTPSVAARQSINLSPSPTLSDSDRSERAPSTSTAVTTPPDSEVERAQSTSKAAFAVPKEATVTTAALPPVSQAVPPRMTLTRTESDQNAPTTVELALPLTPPVVTQQHRVSFAPEADQPERISPPLPVKSPRRASTGTPAPPSWAPNAKSLSGSGIVAGSVSGSIKRAAKAETIQRPTSPSPPLTLSETLPKARSVAQSLNEDPSAMLADSLPKAPPRGTALAIVPDWVSPASYKAPALATQAFPSSAAPTEASRQPVAPVQAEQDARSTSISAASFSNEPFVAKRSQLASVDAARDAQATHSRSSSYSPAHSLVGDSPDNTLSPVQSYAIRAPSRRYAAGDGPPLRSSASVIDSSRPGARASRGVFSDTASIGGRSAMSLPTAYRPAQKPNKVGYLSQPVDDASVMSGVAIQANAAQSLAKNRFSVFASSSKSRSDLPAHLSSLNNAPRADYSEVVAQPSKIGSNEVLVQIYAVSVDQWDRARVEALIARGDGYGFVPGRSFCGKAIECGIDVKRVSKGDFVYGLQDLRKSGALAQRLAVSSDYLTLAPQGALTIEQIASLPCAGVPAFQGMSALCRDLSRGSKVLVLNAHIGTGAVSLQLASALRRGRDLWLACQVPATESEDFCMANGGSEVLRNDPLVVLNSLRESSFDAIVDTVGGRQIYDAARRVLHDNGCFLTTVGDELSPATPKGQWKSGIRSLKRAFVKKDRKAIAYLCPGLDEREDCRETLDRLTKLAEAGQVAPVVKRVLAIEEGGKAFEFGAEQDDATVVRILET